jgi:hypothetical protein
MKQVIIATAKTNIIILSGHIITLINWKRGMFICPHNGKDQNTNQKNLIRKKMLKTE